MAVRALSVLSGRREAARAEVRDAALAALARGDRAGAVIAAEAAGLAAASQAIARSERTPACTAGCSSCCHVNVEATAVEIAAVAAHVERTWTSEALGAL